MPRRRADITFPTELVVVFVDGCFWHGCPQHKSKPKNNAGWWASKLRRNIERDCETDAHMSELGWTVVGSGNMKTLSARRIALRPPFVHHAAGHSGAFGCFWYASDEVSLLHCSEPSRGDGLKRKLIEVSLPLEAINKQAAREKSIRHGHPSTLHLWWARRPLAAARAVLFAQVVDDPSARPDEFPTEEAQRIERARLHSILRASSTGTMPVTRGCSPKHGPRYLSQLMTIHRRSSILSPVAAPSRSKRRGWDSRLKHPT